MAPRPNWKGYLKLSLVSCSIALYPATSASERVSFNQLNKNTGNRIRYKKVDAETEEEVESADIIKGYQVEKNVYLQVDDEELEALQIESSHTIIAFRGSAFLAQQTATARIGWSGPPDNRVSAPNTIQNNGAQGIQLYRGSSAQIFSNTIQNNASHGVFVDRNAQAEIAACLITGNGGDGIRGTRGAAVDTGTDATGATPQFDDDTNTGSNLGFGVRCAIGGFVDGRLGSLTGVLGGSSFAEGCVNSLLP